MTVTIPPPFRDRICNVPGFVPSVPGAFCAFCHCFLHRKDECPGARRHGFLQRFIQTHHKTESWEDPHYHRDLSARVPQQRLRRAPRRSQRCRHADAAVPPEPELVRSRNCSSRPRCSIEAVDVVAGVVEGGVVAVVHVPAGLIGAAVRDEPAVAQLGGQLPGVGDAPGRPRIRTGRVRSCASLQASAWSCVVRGCSSQPWAKASS